MISRNKNECEFASEHYYDMLNPDTINQIPEDTLVHIANCVHCVKKLAQLHESLSEPTTLSQEESSYIRQMPVQLAKHFSLLEAQVDCRKVKEFLPVLAIPALEIKIPTPITVHLDQCPQCSQDFETLRSLKLDSKQRATLAKFFSKSSFESPAECSDLRESIKAITQMRFEHLTADVLRHVCLCKNCRDLLYCERLAMSKRISEFQEPVNLQCEAVKPSDLFDYCLPYGIDPAEDQYAKFRESLTSHLRKCPKCLEKMLQLQKTLSAIAERGESGVVTCYEIASSAKKVKSSDVNDLYADWPIEVQVLDKSRPEPDIVDFPQRLRQRVSAMNLRRFRIPAAAAIILIAVGLFLPVAKAVNLDQIYNALERIKNVCITAFAPGESKPTQEMWISRELKVKMFKTETECVLLDIQGKSRKVKDLNTGSITMAGLDEEMLVKIEEAIEGPVDLLPFPVGLLPFSDISEMPEDAQWQQVTDETIETTITNTQIYDLVWMEKRLGGSIVYQKWRGYIDTETKLPKRIEWWDKHAKEEEYELKTVMETTYPATVEVRAAIRDAGF